MHDETDSKKKSEETSSPQNSKSKLKSSGEVVVRHTETPPPGPADKRIHPRRPLPPVPNRPGPSDKKEKDT